MWASLVAVILFGSVFGMALVLASKGGTKQAQLEALRAELKKIAKEQERANEINNNVSNLSADDARRRLHDVANKQ